VTIHSLGPDWIAWSGDCAPFLPPRSEIDEQVAAYRKLLTQHASALTLNQLLEDLHRLGAKLYASLMQPLEPAIAANRTLIIVPDGALAYLPFEALVPPTSRGASAGRPTSYLVEKFAVLYGPSASALVTVRVMNQNSSAPSKMLLAFGDPDLALPPGAPTAASSREQTRSVSNDHLSSAVPSTSAVAASEDYSERGFSFTPLPYTRDEVLAISKLFPASQRQVYLGPDAREETVKSAKLDDFRYIHFASHGFIDEAKPGRSGIVLSRDPKSSEDGVLQMGEIMRLKMNADLVTLSACSTGLGKLVSGEGMLGLTRSFFYSGARNLTVSLWNVNDSATASLMKTYYENLKRGQPMSVALQHAKLSLLRGQNPAWRHPYFWAPFVLVGDGR
jgi:CHAT domain-containing protein